MDYLEVRLTCIDCNNWLYQQSNSTASAAPFLLHFFDFTLQNYNVKLANLKLKQTKTNFFNSNTPGK